MTLQNLINNIIKLSDPLFTSQNIETSISLNIMMETFFYLLKLKNKGFPVF